jgi:hypothetical protein
MKVHALALRSGLFDASRSEVTLRQIHVPTIGATLHEWHRRSAPWVRLAFLNASTVVPQTTGSLALMQPLSLILRESQLRNHCRRMYGSIPQHPGGIDTRGAPGGQETRRIALVVMTTNAEAKASRLCGLMLYRRSPSRRVRASPAAVPKRTSPAVSAKPREITRRSRLDEPAPSCHAQPQLAGTLRDSIRHYGTQANGGE